MHIVRELEVENRDLESLDTNAKYKIYQKNLQRNLKLVIRFSPNYPNYKYLLKKFPSIFLDATIMHFWPLPKYVLNEVAES